MRPDDDPTSIAIVGPGAIGLALAASLLRRGHPVRLYGRTANAGFQYTFDQRTETFETPIIDDIEATQTARWVILSTKTHQTSATAPWLARLASDDTTLAVVQNGVDHVARVQPHWPRGRILPAVISMPCARPKPDAVTQRRVGQITVPNDPDGVVFSGLFDDRVNVSCTDDWTSAAWTKLLVNAPLGMCAVSGLPNGALLEPPLRAAAEDILREIIAVARVAGAVLEEESALVAATMAKIAKNPEHFSSITQDRKAGRPMEWDARNEVVVRTAERHGLSAPLNQVLCAILASVDAER